MEEMIREKYNWITVKEIQSPLSKSVQDIALGSLLGDGCISINHRYKNARFSFRHSIKQKDYFLWKVEKLTSISSRRKSWIQNTVKNEFGIGKKLRFQSRALPTLSKIYSLVTNKGIKKVNKHWLKALSPLSIAIWWMDDGSLISNTRKGVFCTDAFSEKEIVLLQKYLEEGWNVRTRVGRTSKSNSQKRRYFRLFIQSTEELKKFLRIIIPYIETESMLYKVLILYKDEKLQQRWISEIEELSNYDRNTIEEIVRDRKSKLLYYNRERYSPIPLVTEENRRNTTKMTRVVHAVNFGC